MHFKWFWLSTSSNGTVHFKMNFSFIYLAAFKNGIVIAKTNLNEYWSITYQQKLVSPESRSLQTAKWD